MKDVTPGLENKLLGRNPDHLLVLPWHSKFKGHKLVFPSPKVEVIAP
jgi:hypothetical protein